MKRPNITPPPYTVQLSDHHADDSRIVADGEVVAICCSRGHLGEQHATTRAFAAVPDTHKALERALGTLERMADKLESYDVGTVEAIRAALLKAGYTF